MNIIWRTPSLKKGYSLSLTGILGSTLSFGLLSAAALAADPSFDCAKAEGEVEKMICKNAELATLDQQLAEVYKAALEKAPKDELKTLKAFQRGWVKGRNDCWKAQDVNNCVLFSYESRITELQIAYGDFVVPEPVNYSCEGGDSITAIFYKDTQLPAAVLTRIPNQVVAMLNPSASGSKYEGQNVTFWTKGDDAMVTWDSEGFTCQAQ
ncbi:MAG: MliC family protein [Candidatus Competibacteraceae bacterium]|jgi:uncharacterized protein|nr:MliC family protein [Candidatus Competibacteraceae bacterium]